MGRSISGEDSGTVPTTSATAPDPEAALRRAADLGRLRLASLAGVLLVGVGVAGVVATVVVSALTALLAGQRGWLFVLWELPSLHVTITTATASTLLGVLVMLLARMARRAARPTTLGPDSGGRAETPAGPTTTPPTSHQFVQNRSADDTRQRFRDYN